MIAAIGGPPQALAAKAANTTIPIVFQVGADPVEMGLVASLARPGGTVTGVNSLNVEVGPKRLELMQELLPRVTSLSLLVNSSNATNTKAEAEASEAPARALGLRLSVLHSQSGRELEEVFATLGKERDNGLVIGPDTFLQSRTERIVALAKRHAVPIVTPFREFPASGGLVSYGGDIAESWRQAGVYTGRVLRRRKACRSPSSADHKGRAGLQSEDRRALGLEVPPRLLERADEVIQ